MAFCTALGLAVGVVAVFGANSQGFRVALQATARINLLLFSPAYVGGALGGFKWSSQHLDGSCDEHSKTALGSFWAGAVVLTRSTAGGRARGAAAILGSDCGGHGE